MNRMLNIVLGGIVVCAAGWSLLHSGDRNTTGVSEQPTNTSISPTGAVLVISSTKNFPETLKAMKQSVADAGWSVLNTTNLAGILSERGFTVAPVVVLDICNSKYGSKILSNHDFREFSAFMPCRVSVFQDAEGTVQISRMNMAAMTDFIPPEVAEIMASADEEMAKIIENAVRLAKN